MIGQVDIAIAVALPGFNDLRRSVPPIFYAWPKNEENLFGD